jgi:hypothetical protein
MYCVKNFKTKKEVKAALIAGEKIKVFQPNDLFNVNSKIEKGEHTVYLEGPHYPEAHKWYAQAVIKDGEIVSLK